MTRQILLRFSSRSNDIAQESVFVDAAYAIIVASSPRVNASARSICHPYGVNVGNRAVTELESVHRVAWES